MAQTKARQALNKSRKFAKTTIHICQVVYMAKTKAKQAPDKSNDYQEKTLITWTTHPKNKQGIQAKKTSTKNLHSKRSIMSYYKAGA